MKNNSFFRLVWTIIWHLRTEKEKIYLFWERFNKTLNKCISAENNLKKNKNSECFLLLSQSKYFHTDIWKISLENMENKILSFQFVLVSTKSTHPSYNNGSDQDEPQKQPLEVFCKKSTLRNFAKLTLKHLYQSLSYKSKPILMFNRYFKPMFNQCLTDI